MAEILDGKTLAKKIRKELKLEVEELKQKGIIPKLAVIMVGDNSASQVYVRNKSRACEKVGIEFEEFLFDKDILEVLEDVETNAKKGATIQRYKGLGEMNPEQLWETTMDPSVRRLLKITIEDAQSANDTFNLFMGDEVEPRRDYIQAHAKDVKHLDV